MFGFGKKKQSVLSPLSGKLQAVTEVPDPVFAQKMLGEGFAVQPDEQVQEVLAPISGKLIKLFKTGHAFGIVGDKNGLEVLVHVGIDTVQLKGEGFELLACEGDTVSAGQPIVRVDVPKIISLEKDPITPVVFTKKAQVESVSSPSGDVKAGAKGCTVTLK